jgi:acetate kinase
VQLDDAANARLVGGVEGRITTDGARLAVWVIPTDEELLIARDTFRAVTGVEGRF